MNDACRSVLLVRLVPLLLTTSVLVGCAGDRRSDPAAWQQWVHDEVKDAVKNKGPAWQKPGVEAALIQFGYDYRDRRDRQRLDDFGIDRRLVAELRQELIRKGVPVDSSDGVSWVDVAAERARNTLCPEDVPARIR